MHLATYLHPRLPTDSAEEPPFVSIGKIATNQFKWIIQLIDTRYSQSFLTQAS